MLNFINTETIESKNINVGVWYSEFSEANTLIDKLVQGEDVVKDIKARDRREVFVKKGGLDIRICSIPMNESCRGNRLAYSFVDVASFQNKEGLDFYMNRIKMFTLNNNLKPEYSSCYEHRMMLY